jgi:hypothetical protein
MNKDTDTDMDEDTDMDKDTDMNINKDMDTDMDMDTDLELEHFCKISVRRYSACSALWITYDTSQSNPQSCNKLVASLPDENNDRQIFKNSYRKWDRYSKNVLSELEILV